MNYRQENIVGRKSRSENIRIQYKWEKGGIGRGCIVWIVVWRKVAGVGVGRSSQCTVSIESHYFGVDVECCIFRGRETVLESGRGQRVKKHPRCIQPIAEIELIALNAGWHILILGPLGVYIAGSSIS